MYTGGGARILIYKQGWQRLRYVDTQYNRFPDWESDGKEGEMHHA